MQTSVGEFGAADIDTESMRRRAGSSARSARLWFLIARVHPRGLLRLGIGQVSGAEAAVAVEDRMEGTWTLVAASGTIGFMLALVAALAAWLAGLIRWWAVLAAIAAIVGGFGLLGASVPGTIVLAAGFAVLSIGLARVDPHAWDAVPPADDPRAALTH